MCTVNYTRVFCFVLWRYCMIPVACYQCTNTIAAYVYYSEWKTFWGSVP